MRLHPCVDGTDLWGTSATAFHGEKPRRLGSSYTRRCTPGESSPPATNSAAGQDRGFSIVLSVFHQEAKWRRTAHRATRSCRVIATGGRSAAGHDRVDGTRSGGLPEWTRVPTGLADSLVAAALSVGNGASAEDVRLAELNVGVSEAPVSVEESEAGSGLMSGTMPAGQNEVSVLDIYLHFGWSSTRMSVRPGSASMGGADGKG